MGKRTREWFRRAQERRRDRLSLESLEEDGGRAETILEWVRRREGESRSELDATEEAASLADAFGDAFLQAVPAESSPERLALLSMVLEECANIRGAAKRYAAAIVETDEATATVAHLLDREGFSPRTYGALCEALSLDGSRLAAGAAFAGTWANSLLAAKLDPSAVGGRRGGAPRFAHVWLDAVADLMEKRGARASCGQLWIATESWRYKSADGEVYRDGDCLVSNHGEENRGIEFGRFRQIVREVRKRQAVEVVRQAVPAAFDRFREKTAPLKSRPPK